MSSSSDAARNRDLRTRANGEHRLEFPLVEADAADTGLPDACADLVVAECEILDLVELQAPPEAETREYDDFVTAEWAKRRLAEEIWRARKR